MEITGFGDDVEKWLASGTDVRRLAVPARTFNVPGVGPLLVLAIVGWPDSVTLLTVEPGLGGAAKHATARLALHDSLGGYHPFRQGGSSGGGPYGRMINSATFADPVPAGARALHLYGLPNGKVVGPTTAGPLPPHVTIELD
ncbi:hypothetical protein [Geodermatophilus ruber]|uniref:Uncharacterized protein n=1 Tax=Geodermatophilus ruber TaxID=504800 RepID=A0A1I4DJT7_9ACTN|nr:hypothetical protein [Geodermatophilus ruber]SFK92717.1 hypothetical protein SAMN04488085_104390 [Geodermatophilus ruber]